MDMAWVRDSVEEFLSNVKAIRVALETRHEDRVKCESCKSLVVDKRYCSNCGLRRF